MLPIKNRTLLICHKKQKSVAIKTKNMKIDVQIWDSKNGRFHKETINDEDLSNITKQKILNCG